MLGIGHIFHVFLTNFLYEKSNFQFFIFCFIFICLRLICIFFDFHLVHDEAWIYFKGGSRSVGWSTLFKERYIPFYLFIFILRVSTLVLSSLRIFMTFSKVRTTLSFEQGSISYLLPIVESELSCLLFCCAVSLRVKKASSMLLP